MTRMNLRSGLRPTERSLTETKRMMPVRDLTTNVARCATPGVPIENPEFLVQSSCLISASIGNGEILQVGVVRAPCQMDKFGVCTAAQESGHRDR